MSYFFHAFLPSEDPPNAEEAKAYLLEGALFDTRPEISIRTAPDGAMEEMRLQYDPARKPMVLRRLAGEEAQANRAEAMEAAALAGREDLASRMASAPLVLEWEIERSELDEDAWFALHLWQAWVLGPSRGWLHAPNDGIYDSDLQKACTLRG